MGRVAVIQPCLYPVGRWLRRSILDLGSFMDTGSKCFIGDTYISRQSSNPDIPEHYHTLRQYELVAIFRSFALRRNVQA